ncbi:MAG: right-handed parallel beta-helix repeat-containing protein [Anaerolineales bacterium]
MKKFTILSLIFVLVLQATPGQYRSIADNSASHTALSNPDTTYWVSPDGQAAWANCRGTLPLDGPEACTLSIANTNAVAGDTIYLRAGIYYGHAILPSNSGSSDSNRIIYTNYDLENVTIRDSAYGIYIYKKSYITVNGINFYNLRRFMRIYAGHYNTISYCNFDTRSADSGDWVGALIADDFNDNTPASENSTYNWVHHCTFYRWVYGGYAEHRGGLLDIGSWEEDPVDESYYNLIEDNIFAYGGHHTLGVYSKYNVIRNNYFHNETNPDNWAFEGYRDSITEGPVGGYNLYEGNRFGFSGASGLALRTPNNLLRFNLFYQTDSGGLQVVSSAAGLDHADYNRIYRNSFYHNGHQESDPGFQGGIYFANWSGQSPIGNIVKGNIFYDNKNGAITYEGQVDPQVIEDNWDQNSVDPKFVNLSASDPDNPSLPDLHLQPDSPCIDAGTYPTWITSDTGSGMQFQVGDARYFIDGWGIPHVQGDEIQLTDGQQARITSINYETNSITVDRVLNWTLNQGISLAYQGTAPDLGAYEFEPQVKLHGASGDQTIYLSWTVNITLPTTTTWTIAYDGPAGSPPSPITGLAEPTRTYTLNELTNYTWYTITLATDPPWLTDTVTAMPTDHLIYLPAIWKWETLP